MKAVYNLVWIPNGGGNEIPEKYLENLKTITKQNANHDVKLWIDSKKMVPSEMSRLERIAKDSNLSIPNLREIPEYDGGELYNQEQDEPLLVSTKYSLIWRQVDTARILVCLQGDYEQAFYSDLDVVNLKIDSDEIQNRIKKLGMVIGRFPDGFCPYGENGLFGFDKTQREFFISLYEETEKFVLRNKCNGFPCFAEAVSNLQNNQEILFEMEFLREKE